MSDPISESQAGSFSLPPSGMQQPGCRPADQRTAAHARIPTASCFRHLGGIEPIACCRRTVRQPAPWSGSPDFLTKAQAALTPPSG
jgi:hypothetical protein